MIIVGDAGANSIWSGDGEFFIDSNKIENPTAIKLNFEICPVEKLTLNALLTWAKWTEEAGQNNIGARATFVTSKVSTYPHPVANYGNYNYRSRDAKAKALVGKPPGAFLN